MTDRTTAISEAFDQARAWDRLIRDERIDEDLDRLDRLANSMAVRPGDAPVTEPTELASS
jgi:hypothetical protein